jgi:hypothetical protein
VKQKRKTWTVGTRIKVYHYGSPRYGGTCYRIVGQKATITKRDGDWIECRLDKPLPEKYARGADMLEPIHVKQCRRIK